jgi:hypothetical protein
LSLGVAGISIARDGHYQRHQRYTLLDNPSLR